MSSVRLSVNELAKACAHSSNASEWSDFLRRCTPLASVVALRVARLWTNSATPAIVEDIVQELFLKLCEQERRILRDFEPRGDDSFFGLLRIVTASVANDYFRRQRSAKRGGKVVTSSLGEDTNPLHVSGDDCATNRAKYAECHFYQKQQQASNGWNTIENPIGGEKYMVVQS